MALDAATLALTAAELKTTLADAKIAKLFEPTRDELVITLRTRTETDSLLLSARSGSARVCLTEESFENPETPPSFCMLMRKHLTGGRLLDVRMEPGDRIVYFEFQCTNEMGDLVRNTLCAYHAGWGSVKSWLADPQYAPDGRQVEQIPFADTRDYVQKVERAMEIYRRLYPDKMN